MKYIKIAFFICVIYTLFSQKMSAQESKKINVDAIVLDVRGNHIPGAIITSDKDKITVVANESGEFSIVASANSLLSVNAIGFKADNVMAKTGLKTVVLKSTSSDLVQVAFNQVDKADLLGGVSSVNVADMLKSNFYTYSLDNLSSYVPGYSGSSSWGMNDKLVIVDGIPRDEYNVIPSEIEQITVLKSDAAVALYGSRAAKGVVSITTKRGTANDKTFKVRYNTGIMVPKGYVQYLGSSDYMKLYNEASANDGKAALYTDADIANSASGANPYRYPSTDFYSSKYLKKYASRSDVNTELSGGNERARYYLNVGNYNTNTLMNFGYGTKEGENRFNVRANLDIKLSDKIASKINSSVTMYDKTTAYADVQTSSYDNYWTNAAKVRPNLFSPLIPTSYLSDATSLGYAKNSSYLIDGQYLLGGAVGQTTNNFADMYTKGYVKSTTRKYQFDVSLNFNLSSILKGLTFDTQFGIDYNTSYDQNIFNDNTYAVYIPTWKNNDSISSLTKSGNTDNALQNRTIANSYQRQTTFASGAFKYKNTFNGVHNVSAILLAHGYSLLESGVYHATANANLGLQVGYNYMQKYYIDFTGNAVHSTKLAPGHRNAISPTVSLGWRISGEDFLSKVNVINDLKVTASAGILNTDLDYTGYYWYKGIYSSDNGSYYSWQEGRQLRTVDVTRGENYNLGYEKRKELSLGLEASLFDRAIQVNGSYFYSKLAGIPIQNANLFPNYLSVTSPSTTSFIPYVNYNCDQRSGFDLGINYRKRIHEVELSVGLVATYYETSAAIRSESNTYAYQNLQGKPLDAIMGLKSLGFFKDAADVAASPKQSWGTVQPGDIKYEDVNHDGIVDDKDKVYLGRSGQNGDPLTLGLNATVKWNNFSFFVLVNRSSGSIGMKSTSDYWASAGTSAKYSEAMLGRWTEATAETATYPRLTTTTGDNNYRNSTFWLYKKDQINLARVQLSYDIPKKILAKTFISDLGLFLIGNDLLRIAKERKYLETNVGSSPQTRLYTIGVKASF